MVSASEQQLLTSLEKELQPIAGKEGGNYRTKLQYLKLVKKLGLRRSERVAKHGLDLLNDASLRRKLGDDVWDVYEQVAIACLDCNNLDIAKECIASLMLRFPHSLRVGRLEGMWLEASGMFEQATRVYSNLLDDHPNDQLLLKRQAASLKSQGNLLGAVEALRSYLEIYMADTSAWRELGEIYLSLLMYKQAAFCFEELLLSSPANPLYNRQLAEVLYALGGADNFRLARGYFAAAIEFSNGDDLRSLYGICLCHAALAASSRSSRPSASKSDESSTELAELAADSIEALYRDKCPSKLKLVRGVVEKLVKDK